MPAILLFCLLPFCPESPRQLIYRGRLEEAEGVLLKIYNGATVDQVRSKVALISAACEEAKELNENQSRWSKIKQLHTNPANLRALIAACGLMVISQMSGFNTLMYYSSTLFALVGFADPVAVGLVVAGTNFIMTWVNMMCVDPLGRRRVLVATVWGMAAGLLAVAIAFSFIPINTKTLAITTEKISAPAIVVLVFIIWFVFFYGVSVGNTAWMSTDFFPMEVRAMGTMWLTCSCWGSNIIVSSTFLSMMKGLTPSGAFGFCEYNLTSDQQHTLTGSNRCCHLLHWVDPYHLLLPRGVRLDARRDWRSLQAWLRCAVREELEEGACRRDQGENANDGEAIGYRALSRLRLDVK